MPLGQPSNANDDTLLSDSNVSLNVLSLADGGLLFVQVSHTIDKQASISKQRHGQDPYHEKRTQEVGRRTHPQVSPPGSIQVL